MKKSRPHNGFEISFIVTPHLIFHRKTFIPGLNELSTDIYIFIRLCVIFVICSFKAKKPCFPLILSTLGDYLRKERLNRGLSLISVSRLLKICPDTINAWEENRKSPRLRASHRIIDFLGYFPPIATSRFSIRKRLYFARLILGETQREAAKKIGIGASKFINIELGKRRVTFQIKEKIQTYITKAFSIQKNKEDIIMD